eukprot:5350799-Lingulodinium_polyedra.AAC.1
MAANTPQSRTQTTSEIVPRSRGRNVLSMRTRATPKRNAQLACKCPRLRWRPLPSRPACKNLVARK